MQTEGQLLVVITGPVGGGTSSTGLALRQAIQRLGLSAAVIDLDLVYGFVRQPQDSDDETAWDGARAGAAGLANAFFDKEVAVVIVEGEFFTPKELDALLAPMHANVTRDLHPQGVLPADIEAGAGRSVTRHVKEPGVLAVDACEV